MNIEQTNKELRTSNRRTRNYEYRPAPLNFTFCILNSKSRHKTTFCRGSERIPRLLGHRTDMNIEQTNKELIISTGSLKFYILDFTFCILNSKSRHKATFCRGSERIRTAVGAFAELCLATRPQNQLKCRIQNKEF